MAKPGSISAKPLSVLLSDVFSDAYAKQGFAARELVTRWADIAGPEIAAHSQPLKMQWPRPVEGQPQLRLERSWPAGAAAGAAVAPERPRAQPRAGSQISGSGRRNPVGGGGR